MELKNLTSFGKTTDIFREMIEKFGVPSDQSRIRIQNSFLKMYNYNGIKENFNIVSAFFELRQAYFSAENKNEFLFKIFGSEDYAIGKILVELKNKDIPFLLEATSIEPEQKTPMIDRAIYGSNTCTCPSERELQIEKLIKGWTFGKPTNVLKIKSLNPTLDCLEKRFNRTGQTPSQLFPKGWDLTQYLDLVTDRKKMYLHFANYYNNKKPLTWKK